MYLSLLLITLGLVLDHPVLPHLLAFVALLAVLIIKLNHEERLLLAALPGYAAYQKRTKRLIPFVY
jgi:protein-S-isoprenylcysteine O-methyltransferase Ste14